MLVAHGLAHITSSALAEAILTAEGNIFNAGEEVNISVDASYQHLQILKKKRIEFSYAGDRFNPFHDV